MSDVIQFDPRPAISKLGAFSEKIDWALQRLVSRVAQETAREMKRNVRKLDAMAFSTLINSIRADQLGALDWQVATHVRYAWYVRYGRRAGGRMPPLQKIQDWVNVRLRGKTASRRVAWLIARAIRRRGQKPRDFVTPTRQWAQRRLAQLGAETIRNIAKGGQ